MANFRCLKSIATLIAVLGAVVGSVDHVAAQNRDGSIVARFGVFGQGQFTTIDATNTTPAADVPVLLFQRAAAAPIDNNLSDKLSGNFYGGGLSLGADWRPGRYVLGIEGDISANGGQVGFSNAKFTSAYLTTLRGRLGYVVHPDWTLYGTLGIAALGTEIRADNGGSKAFHTQPGFIYGAGLEREFKDFVLSGEYLHSHFGANDSSVSNGPLVTTNFSTSYDVNVFRLGLKLKVGHDFYHDDVAERIRK
jgi:outer membrane immunogenic protein